MIVDLLVSAILGVLTALLSLAPSFSVPEYSALTHGSQLGVSLAYFNRILPVADMVVIISAGLAVAAAVGMWNLVLFVYDKLPFKAT